ncbi:MAG: hypothetical protein M9962_07770 [Oligoflexia bacterium]|nr:hypothetical protein [Oligoflexia bacterium]
MFKIFCFIFLLPAVSQATFSGKGDVFFQTGYREFPNEGFGTLDSSFETIFKTSYAARYTNPYFRLELTPELRAFYSAFRDQSANSIGYATVESPRRLMNLEWKVVDKSKQEMLLDIERLTYTSYLGRLEMQIGRKPIGVGTLKVIPIWNKFSRPLPNSAGPNFIYGQDSLTIRYQKDIYAFQAIDIEGRDFRSYDAVRWLEAIAYHPEIEFHLMASRWWENNSLGFALAKDLLGATLRLESLWIDFDNKREQRELQLGVGVEYALNEIWTLLFEGLYYEKGKSSSADYALDTSSRFRALRAKGYGFFQASAQLTSFWLLNISSMTNFVDGSFYPMIKLSRSLSDNWDIAMDVRFPVGKPGTEFSKRTFEYPKVMQNQSIGAPSQIGLQLTVSY